jgi:capsular polysaccharide export protein
MTSLLGFEALIRGKAITCLGRPFYSGWGLTHDRHEVPRRQARPDILGLIHACLIEYPRYFDPMSKLPCPPEVVIERLAAAADLPQACYLRPLAKIQGVFASQAHLWRNMR